MTRYRASHANRLLDAVLPLPEANWDADWRVRLPASLVLAAARAALRVPAPAPGARSGTAVLAFYHLGDQLRMLNVLSRFPLDEVVVHTNVEAAAPLGLYANVTRGRTFERHGLISFLASTRDVPAVGRMLVPHPTMTLPSALGFARRAANHTFAASTGEYELAAPGVDFVRADRTSWRAFYESFFEEALGMRATRGVPNVSPRFRYAGGAGRRIVCHLTAGLAERRIPAGPARAIVRDLVARGFEPVLLGVAAERAFLEEIAAAADARLFIGRSLADVAELMAASRAFVGLESSMMHLADAVGLPSVIVYSATSAAVQGPFYTATIPIAAAVPTIRDVSVLTGRLGRPQCDWERIDVRIATALATLLHDASAANAGRASERAAR